MTRLAADWRHEISLRASDWELIELLADCVYHAGWRIGDRWRCVREYPAGVVAC